MEFNLHTYDIQYLIIALVIARHDPMIAKEYDRLSDLLDNLNGMCSEENDNTLAVTVRA